MASKKSHNMKRKKGKHQRSSRLAHAGFYLNALLFVLSMGALSYHIFNMMFNYGISASDWLDYLMLAGGYGLFLTWHYRIVFLRVYRAIDGLYLHLFAFAGVMGLWWTEMLFPVVESAHIQGILLPVTGVWLAGLLLHIWFFQQGCNESRQMDSAIQHEPDISRLIDDTEATSSATHSARSAGKKRSRQTD